MNIHFEIKKEVLSESAKAVAAFAGACMLTGFTYLVSQHLGNIAKESGKLAIKNALRHGKEIRNL